MLPQLRDHQRLFINKIAYRIGSIQHGDVVVFHYPYDPTKIFIKRVIAEPGESVRVSYGSVYVNGRKLVEYYEPANYADGSSMAEMIVPDHEYFVMGDHRRNSNDSRRFGPVSQDLICGKAVFVYWPLGQVHMVH